MAHAYHHSVSTARRFRGLPEDYLSIHEWIDGSKIAFSDHRHRALRHHSFGVFACEERFGKTITNSDGIKVPVRTIAELHITEDLGFVPSVQDWLKSIDKEFWMTGKKLVLEENDISQENYKTGVAKISEREKLNAATLETSKN
jgi:hypothetical protein